MIGRTGDDNVHLCEMMDVHLTYGDNHFMMYVRQIIMFYTLNVYSAVFQLYFTKSEGKIGYTIYIFSHSEGEIDFSQTYAVHL